MKRSVLCVAIVAFFTQFPVQATLAADWYRLKDITVDWKGDSLAGNPLSDMNDLGQVVVAGNPNAGRGHEILLWQHDTISELDIVQEGHNHSPDQDGSQRDVQKQQAQVQYHLTEVYRVAYQAKYTASDHTLRPCSPAKYYPEPRSCHPPGYDQEHNANGQPYCCR